ncbi:DUF5343 domain-containing protein [Rhizobium leguminosarum]
MPVISENPGPYAPSTAIIGLIERHRNKGLPSPVDSEVLGRAGISDSLIPRTLQAMQTLDLLDEDKRPTEIFEGLRKASEPDFRNRVAEWLNAAYADALAFIEPSTAEETDIRDAFRSYKPIGQQDRMVTLFIGLYAYAGIRAERAPRQPAVRKTSGSKINPTSRATRPGPCHVNRTNSRAVASSTVKRQWTAPGSRWPPRELAAPRARLERGSARGLC